MPLKTDYKDDIINVSANTNRVFNIVDDQGNVIYSGVSLVETTDFVQEGDSLGASDVNDITININTNSEAISELDATKQNTLAQGTTTGNINNMKESGVYWIDGRTATGYFPITDNYYILLVFKVSAEICVQILVPYSATIGNSSNIYSYKQMFYRMFANNAWRAWFSVSDIEEIQLRINQSIAHIGKYSEGETATSFSGKLDSGVFVPVGEITLYDNDNGTWIFEGTVQIGSNTSGYRGLTIATSTPNAPLIRVAPSPNTATRLQVTRIINVSGISSSRKYTLYAFQNSGSTLTGSLVEFRATRI